MLKNIRLEKILNIVNSKGYASLRQLMRETSSSESTIRADLVYLEKEGKIVRLHGGAKSLHAPDSFKELNVDEKIKMNVKEKEAIGEYAASLIKKGMVVYIDAGTTTSCICDYIDVDSVTIVTNSMTIAQKLTEKKFNVYATGGVIKLSTDAFIGTFTKEIINKFSFDIGFFGSNGISYEQGFTTPDYEEAAVKENAISRCKQAFILCDSSKFDIEAEVRFATFDDATLITDKIVNPNYKGKNIIEVNK